MICPGCKNVECRCYYKNMDESLARTEQPVARRPGELVAKPSLWDCRIDFKGTKRGLEFTIVENNEKKFTRFIDWEYIDELRRAAFLKSGFYDQHLNIEEENE